jgi:demethylmenaquinone methyltransferase/2-methoxy-6-polyprenyl-1,4-benzoquinol methylase
VPHTNSNTKADQEFTALESPRAGDSIPRTERLYSRAASLYDRVNLSVSFGNGYRYRADQIKELGISSGDHVLDIGSGTGILARTALEFTGADGRVVALDPCQEMLELARESGVYETTIGTIDELPFEESSFDFVTAGYSLRYARDMQHALREINRVLKPGGTALILEITPPTNTLMRLLAKAYILVAARMIALVATRSLTSQRLLGHLWREIRTTPQPTSFLISLAASGFHDCTCGTTHGLLTAYTAVK